MNDLLAELDCINDDGGSSNKKQDGSSSPLRPNPKYCSMAQPQSARPAAVGNLGKRAAAYAAARLGANPMNRGPRPWENAQGSASTPVERIPETVQKILAAASSMTMEIDDNVSDGSSSPLKPNEKYCTILTPSRPRVARVAPLPATVQQHPQRPVQPVHRDAMWIPEGKRHDGRRRSTSPHRNSYRNPDVPGRSREAPPHPASYSNPQSVDRTLSPANHYPVPIGPPFLPYASHSNPYGPNYGLGAPLGFLPFAGNYILPNYGGFHGPNYGRNPGHVRDDREKVLQKIEREAEDQKRINQNEKRYEQERKKRIEAEKEERWRKAEDEERRRREGKERRRGDSERRARSQLKSYTDVKPKREEGTVSMTREELEELKAKCKAEGEQKALADAKKAEAVARLESCLKNAEERSDEPEPMDVEESDTVESSIPSTSSHSVIAPIPLIIKSEPQSEDELAPKDRAQEIPTLAGVTVKKEEKSEEDKEKAAEREEEEVAKKESDGEIAIIEKSPAEVLTLTDDEGTVAADSKESLREFSSTSEPAAAEDEELWVIATKRGRKKKAVFDPSKVKRENEDESASVARDSSEPILPFIASKVKPEPADSVSSRGSEVRTDTVPQSVRVETEVADDGARRDTVAVPTVVVPVTEAVLDTVTMPVTVADPGEEEEKAKEKRRIDTERRARAQLKSYAGVQPKRDEAIVTMTIEELEQKALADARKAEAIARLESCLKRVKARNNEVRDSSERTPNIPVDTARRNTVAAPTVAVPVTVPVHPLRPPSQPLPDYEEEEGRAVPPRPVQQMHKPVGEEGGQQSVEAALAAARRLIRQIGETVHSQQQHHQHQQQRPVRQPRQAHQPSAGSFLHSLRTASRKRRRCCDEEEDEWKAKRARTEEAETDE